MSLLKLVLQLLAHRLQLHFQSRPAILLDLKFLLGCVQPLGGVLPGLSLFVQGIPKLTRLDLRRLESLQRVLCLLRDVAPGLSRCFQLGV